MQSPASLTEPPPPELASPPEVASPAGASAHREVDDVLDVGLDVDVEQDEAADLTAQVEDEDDVAVAPSIVVVTKEPPAPFRFERDADWPNDEDAPTRFIAMMNQKGGVGKTTTTVNLGAALAAAGRRVLLMDLDPQAHLTLHVGVDPDRLEVSAYHLLTDDSVTAAQTVQQIWPNLWVLPAEVNLAGAETELAPKLISGRAQRMLRNKCLPLLEAGIDGRPFNYVLIDCPPSLGLLTVNAMTLAREVIVPMQAHFLGLQGLSKLLETVQLIKESFNPDLEVSGIILCMHESQTILANEVTADLSAFLESARGTDAPWRDAVVFEPAVRRNIKLAECPSFGKTIFDYAPRCAGASDYHALARSVARQTAQRLASGRSGSATGARGD